MNPIVKRYLKAGLNIAISIITILLLVFIVPKVLLFFIPFVIAWIVASIANPLVRFLTEKMKIKRKASSAIVILLVILFILALGYVAISVLVGQIIGFTSSLPEMWSELEKTLISMGIAFDKLFDGFPKEVQDAFTSFYNGLDDTFSKITDPIGENLVSVVGTFAKNLTTVIISIVMCILSSYWFVAGREETSNFFKKHTPIRLRERISIVYNNLKLAVGGYIKAQVRIELYIYILMVIGFVILGVQYGLLIALGIGFLDMLPLFGTGIVLLPWVVIEFVQGDYKMVVGLLLIWGIGQLVRQIIQPKIVGESIGVAPLPTLFFLFIGYRLAGVLGMIVAIPFGIIIIKLEEAGAFDTPKNSIKLLAKTINEFRQITPEDIAYINEGEVENMDIKKESTNTKKEYVDVKKERADAKKEREEAKRKRVEAKKERANIRIEEKHAREEGKKRKD